MSDVTTTTPVVNAQTQAEQAAQLSAEQQAEVLAEAKRELGLVVKALRGGNRENAVSQYLAGMHGLRFVNLCRKGGKARSFATDELERDLSWWMGRSTDANLILRTYAAIALLHGDITPPPSSANIRCGRFGSWYLSHNGPHNPCSDTFSGITMISFGNWETG